MDYTNSYHPNQWPAQQPPAPQQPKRIKPWLLAVIIGLSVLVVWVICLFFIHIYSDATCTSPKKCYICGKTEGAALAHQWSSGSCDIPGKCSLCGVSSGVATEHSWVAATCTAPQHCSNCQVTVGELAGHTWMAATCTAPAQCQHCGIQDGSPTEHSWAAATCTAPAQCRLCGIQDGNPSGHSWAAATYLAPETCTQCGATSGSPLSKPDINVENQVVRIRNIVNPIAENASAGNYRKVNLRNGVVAYYDGSQLKKAVVYRRTDGIGAYSDTYSRTYYFEDNTLIFAFFEGKDSHRLYFYQGALMRWRYTPQGTKTATNHDYDFSDEYFLWEQLALEEVGTFF